MDDYISKFSDDPNMINVAVSRAKKRLCLVISGNEQPTDSNVCDLIDYISYHRFEIMESQLYSIFDLLYSQYTESRIEFLKKHSRISRYDSENIMYGALVEILKEYPDLTLKIICQKQLNMIIKDTNQLSEEEAKYVSNPATSLDFLLYNPVSQKSVLAIEVDGFRYHQPGTRQAQRDRMKDHILELYGIPLIRLPTTGYGEIEKIKQFLESYKKQLTVRNSTRIKH